MTGILIPQHIFVGDTAQFFFLLSEQEYAALTGHGFTGDVPIPLKNITQNNVMTINEIRIVTREGGYYLAITFVPWETGNIEFPDLTPLQLKNKLPTISVASLLGTGERVSLQPPKPPLLPPGTDFLLYGAAVVSVAFLAAFGTGIWVLLRKMQKKKHNTTKKRLAALRKQLKRLYKEARKIKKHLSIRDTAFDTSRNFTDMDPTVIEVPQNTKNAVEAWYADIDRCLREYIQALCTDTPLAVPPKDEAYFLSATYTELTETLMKLFAPKQEIIDLFCIFYAMLEQQRFASTPSNLICNYTTVSQDMLKQLPRIAERAEAAYALLVR